MVAHHWRASCKGARDDQMGMAKFRITHSFDDAFLGPQNKVARSTSWPTATVWMPTLASVDAFTDDIMPSIMNCASVRCDCSVATPEVVPEHDQVLARRGCDTPVVTHRCL